jgi:hypothetical protein
MRRLAVLIGLVGAACSDAGTDPNAVVAVRFDGSAYPSIVAGDSLRDSLGALQPLKATGLNYKGEPVADAAFVFSSPDTILRMFTDGVVFARGRKPDGIPARVVATSGSLQSQPDSLVVVPRADSMKAAKDIDTIPMFPTGGTTPDTLRFNIFGDTLAGAPKPPIPSWLVTFQVQHRGVLLSPTDTSFAFTFERITTTTPSRRVATFVDTTDASGKVERRVFVRSLSTGVSEDTIFLIATARARKAGLPPISAKTMILVRPQ